MFLNFTEEDRQKKPLHWTGPYLVLWYDYAKTMSFPWWGVVLPDVTLSMVKGVAEGEHWIAYKSYHYVLRLVLRGDFGNGGQPFPTHEPQWREGVLEPYGALNHYELPIHGQHVPFLRGLKPEHYAHICEEIRRQESLDKLVLSNASKSDFMLKLQNRREDDRLSREQNMFTKLRIRESARRP